MNAQHRAQAAQRVGIVSILVMVLALTVAFALPNDPPNLEPCPPLPALDRGPVSSAGTGSEATTLPVGMPVRAESETGEQVYAVLDDGRAARDPDGGCRVPQDDNNQHPWLLEASTKVGAQVWSEPNVWSGRVIDTLPVGLQILVAGTPVSGPVGFDGDVMGNWYWVYQGGTAGWVASDRLVVMGNRAGLATIAATASANGRMWSVPDVWVGHLVGQLEEGEPVNVIRGPVDGTAPPQAADGGAWYQVLRGNGDTGWLWIERLVD